MRVEGVGLQSDLPDPSFVTANHPKHVASLTKRVRVIKARPRLWPCTHKSRLVSGGWSMSALPQKRTFVSAVSMSALCH